jgi:hypothetical protein
MYFKHSYYYSYPYVNVIKGLDMDKRAIMHIWQLEFKAKIWSSH